MLGDSDHRVLATPAHHVPQITLTLPSPGVREREAAVGLEWPRPQGHHPVVSTLSPLTRGGGFAAVLLILFPCIATVADRADWPQFLGPTRDGVYAGPDLAKSWPAGGPKVVWKRDVGQGFAGPAVAEGKLVLFHRARDRERVDCFDAKSGKPLWT